jgi:NADH:ubiquinone oxidoreductase subunit F (NADH-binding)
MISTDVVRPTTVGALIGLDPAAQLDLREHLAAHGPLPSLNPHEILGLASDAGLTGRGGAGFPLWRKIEAVLNARGAPVVVGNGAEGEPASTKDRWLLTHRPHLVLDGLQLAAQAVAATDVYLHVTDRMPGISDVLAQRYTAGFDAVAVRRSIAPERFISGEESAVVNSIAGGPAIPRSKPPRVVERGFGGRPTLVSNVETLAHLALVARRGAAWFRSSGTADAPGTMLLTVGGAVRRPGVVEAPQGAPLRDVLDLAGGLSGPMQAVLLGGYHGTWLTGSEAASARMSRSGLAAFGASPGAGDQPGDELPRRRVRRPVRPVSERVAAHRWPRANARSPRRRSGDRRRVGAVKRVGRRAWRVPPPRRQRAIPRQWLAGVRR